MSEYESNKNLAGVGALLLALSFIPILGIVGIILILVSMKGLAKHFQDDTIYRNALMGVIYTIIGLVAFVALFAGLILGLATSMFTGGLSALFALGFLLVAGVVLFVFYLLGAIQFRKAFATLAQKSGEHNFETAGFLMLIGAILTIVFFIGLIIVFIAWLIAAIAFFSMKTQAQQQQPYAYATQSTPTLQPAQTTGFCPYCGAPREPNSLFCRHCGKQLT
jgi:uncharacterized membrane protein